MKKNAAISIIAVLAVLMAMLPKGTACRILEIVRNDENEEWARVEVRGETGYVQMNYLEMD